jgi:hypothetical protein
MITVWLASTVVRTEGTYSWTYRLNGVIIRECVDADDAADASHFHKYIDVWCGGLYGYIFLPSIIAIRIDHDIIGVVYMLTRATSVRVPRH